MTKKMREILAKIEAKNTEAKSFMEGENKDVAKANDILAEIKDLKAEYEAEKALAENDKLLNTPSPEEIANKAKEKTDPLLAFAEKLDLMNK